MLADDVSVHGSGRDAEFLRQQVTEARRVKITPGPDDAVLWQLTNLPSHVRKDIYGVAGDHDDSVRAVFDQLLGIIRVNYLPFNKARSSVP